MRTFLETFEEEAYPPAFSFDEFDSLKNYSKMQQYAKTRLQRLGSGSARIIYKVDDTMVLKVAKNVKGLAQNNIEADWSLQRWCPIVAKIFRVGNEIKNVGPFYLEMELAKKVSVSRFTALAGISLNELTFYLMYRKNLDRANFNQEFTPNLKLVKTKMENNEFVNNLMNLINDYDMSYPGDFTKTSTYGEVVRNGEPHLVLVDFGLTSNVWYDYYKR